MNPGRDAIILRKGKVLVKQMEVSFYATLRRVVGAKTVIFDLPPGTTLAELLETMLAQYPLLERELLDEAGNLYQHVHIFVNGRDSAFLDKGMDSKLDTQDTIGVFPAVGGG